MAQIFRNAFGLLRFVGSVCVCSRRSRRQLCFVLFITSRSELRPPFAPDREAVVACSRDWFYGSSFGVSSTGSSIELLLLSLFFSLR